MKRSILARVVIAGLLFLVLGGPASGHVGSCSESTDAAADPEAFCRARKTWVCARLQAAAAMCAGAPPFTQEQYDDCRARIAADCSGARFDATCVPRKRQTDACIDALSRMENVCIPEAMITECNLCSGT